MRCTRCGGLVELVDAHYDDETASELYQCDTCGAEGNLWMDIDPDIPATKTGCLA